jgi:ankyrin repeat protein
MRKSKWRADSFHYSLLIGAARHGHAEMVNMLLATLCLQFSPRELNAALFSAVSNRHSEVVRILREIADVETRDAYSMTPLHIAVLNDDEECVKLLLAAIEAQDYQQSTALHLAATKGSPCESP